jgi:hypothetical protein
MLNRALWISAWYVLHYRNRAKEAGVFHVAKQLRKQGVPVEIAVLILA